MAYKKVGVMDIYEILRRRKAGQSITHISEVLGYDRKTVRKYLNEAEKYEFTADLEKDRENLIKLVHEQSGRPSRKRDLLRPYLEEITGLITNENCPLKLKTAYEVLCERHDLEVSYVTFTRFVKEKTLSIFPDRSTCRIETEPGAQVQVDYCKAGLLYDPVQDRRRTVYAIIFSLSYSRHKYVEFVYSQDQKSFVNSHVNMFNYFGGVPKTIVIDNLKSGVIKPDLYDPRLNRTYAELADHYGCFIDPCRVGKAKDKAKVERDVQTVREQFRKLVSINPNIIISEANTEIIKWIKNKYGMTRHGTTGNKPYLVFTETERTQLMPLPEEPYETAQWKQAVVHPDHYIQVNKRAYSVPHPYVGKKVWVKVTQKMVEVYHNEKLIKQHIKTDKFRHTDPKDFPENFQHVLDSGIHAYLQRKAAFCGKYFEQLVRKTLIPHAFLNLRKAQALVSLSDKYPKIYVEQAAQFTLTHDMPVNPKQFKTMVEKIMKKEIDINSQLTISSETKEFVREINYYSHQ